MTEAWLRKVLAEGGPDLALGERSYRTRVLRECTALHCHKLEHEDVGMMADVPVEEAWRYGTRGGSFARRASCPAHVLLGGRILLAARPGAELLSD